MGFWRDWYGFIKANAKEHMKRISICIGSFLVLILTAIPMGIDIFVVVVYAGFVETGSIILMTLFGKNGNGNNQQKVTNNEYKPRAKRTY